MHRTIYNKERMIILSCYNILLSPTGWHLIPFPPPQRVYGRTLRHNRISRMESLPIFFTHGAQLRALSARELSYYENKSY